MAAKGRRSAQDVLSFLRSRREEGVEAVAPKRQREFRQAAAVLAGIQDLAALNPVGRPARPGEASAVLRGDVVPATGRKLAGKVMLAPDVRREALRDLGSPSAMLGALEANSHERSGRVQAQLERYLRGEAPALTDQSPEELDETLQVVLWLEGIVEGLPSIEDVRGRSEYLRMIGLFEGLAGDAIFHGRRGELDRLRRYVGVLPPQALLARLAEKAMDWAQSPSPQRGALSIFGPGGVGKSALIARFMLEHARLPDEIRVPFAYLDFDRPMLDISDPLTLCLEMLRQLHLQFPREERFRNLLEFLTREMVTTQATPLPTEDLMNSARSILADLLGDLQQTLGPRPYVVVLDTFEEVQYQGEHRAFPFWEVLAAMQRRAPFLRVVVSGRAPVTTLRQLGENAPEPLEVGELDHEAAVGFLRAHGVTDAELAGRLASQVGGVPLSLKLAASLVAREAPGANGIEGLRGKSRFWLSAADEVIQGVLYERILGHIHDRQVERLAYPGLVLRRVTPELILHVLKEPCGLTVETLEEARALWESLRQETALVSVDDAEGAVVHRADVRRVMLGLLRQKAPAQIEAIHRRAVAWYGSEQGRRARAEELYHRLHLGEPIDADALTDREIRASLQTSIIEYPVDVQVRLASFGFQVSEEILKRATREQRDAHRVSRIEELLPYGATSLLEAQRIVAEVMPSIDYPSPLFRVAARVAAQQEDDEEAARWLERGLALAASANETQLTLDLLSEKAWASRGASGGADLTETLEALAEYAARHQQRTALVQYRAQLWELTRWDPRAAEAAETLRDLSRLVSELRPNDLWGLVPALGPVLPTLLRARGDLTGRLCAIVGEPDGPFRVASFVDRRPRMALDRLLLSAEEGRSSGSKAWERFAKAFTELLNTWPYRVLHVQPPYGHSSDQLRESMA